VAVTDGAVLRVNGPVVEVGGLPGLAMLDVVAVGEQGLPGEVIALEGDRAVVQVYEHTGGLRPGDPVRESGGPLRAELGPGLVGGVFDGMLRRLAGTGYVEPGRGGSVGGSALSREARWRFTPSIGAGARAVPGTLLGSVPETVAIEHRVIVPWGMEGQLDWIAGEGEYTVDDTIAVIGGRELALAQRWPVRRPRPAKALANEAVPLRTGQRVLDLLFPLARGSTAAVPGGFGTGKTLLLQQIAKWCDADVIVYVGCGERGNELADVLHELSVLEDPRTGRALLDRTVLIANTSNMPVLAREASIHTGATVGEYFRDMGYDTVLIADSTSRWAEALREVASRTGELPAEEGYPAGLAYALAGFYERSGRVRTLSGEMGSLTVLGAVSPPGGDMTEPVTAHTRRFVRCVWALDRDLAYARHYPAISWRDSSSRDAEAVGAWYGREGDPGWYARRLAGVELLSEADRLESIAQLIGAASLPDRERVVLLAARLLREAVLAQNATSDNDARCGPEKGSALLALVLDLYERCLSLLERGVSASQIEELDLSDVVRLRDRVGPDEAAPVHEARAAAAALLEGLVP
jgi:V/A-type H+-transporting ATPase subunit A